MGELGGAETDEKATSVSGEKRRAGWTRQGRSAARAIIITKASKQLEVTQLGNQLENARRGPWGLRCACARQRQPFAGGVPLAFGSGPCGALFDFRPRKIMAARGNGCAQRRNAGSIPRSLLMLLVWSGGAKGQCPAGYLSSSGTCYPCTAVRINPLTFALGP